MTEYHTLYVSHSDDNVWCVCRGKGGEVLAKYDSRKEAEAAARKTVAAAGGGDVCVEVPEPSDSKS